MNTIKKIIPTILSAIMLLQSAAVPSASAVGDAKVPLNPERIERKTIDKRIVGAGIGVAVGVPVCIALGFLVHHCAGGAETPSCGAETPSYRELKETCDVVKPLLKKDGRLPSVNGPTLVVADLHGDFKAAKFYCDRFREKVQSNPNTKIVFLGDYIDRGENSIEILYMLFKLKIAFPNNVYLLCGNHEEGLNGHFYSEELKKKYPSNDERIAKLLYNDVFNCLPLAAVVNNEIFCVHGGISPAGQDYKEPISLSQIRGIGNINKTRNCDGLNQACNSDTPDGFIAGHLLNVDYREDLPEDRLFIKDRVDFNYSPPHGYAFFSKLAVDAFLRNNKLKMIVRGHEHPKSGKEVACDGKVVTLLSAPKYCGEYNNDGYALYFSGENASDGAPIYKDIICKK